mgnify:CR=1 FL=1
MVKYMKRIILYLILLIMPLNALAYSNKIIAGGESIGIDIKSNGIMIVGFYRVGGKLNNNNLKVGDIIYKVANTPVSSISELTKEVSKNVKDNKVTIGIKRGEDKFDVIFNLYKDGDNYRTGLYVKDGISGIGTLTYVDPETKIYGALGHEIVESASMKRIEVKKGTIFRSSVTNIEPSARGYAGTKNAKFYSNDIYGNIYCTNAISVNGRIVKISKIVNLYICYYAFSMLVRYHPEKWKAFCESSDIAIIRKLLINCRREMLVEGYNY